MRGAIELDSGQTGAIWPRALAAALFVLGWIPYVYSDAAAAMVDIWLRSETFNHCFLILPISAWLIWRQRLVLGQMQPIPSPSAFGVIAIIGAAWLGGQLATVNALTQFAMVAMLVMSVPVLFGYAIARKIAFPLAFLFFMVPFGEFVMPAMMDWTADFTVLALRLSGIPVYREGLQFVIPSGNWSVVEACSGVRYLIASFTVGTLFAYLNYRSPVRRLIFMLVSLLVPVVANWLRAYIIVMLGHLSNNKIATGVDHLIYGWVFFGVVIMIMFAIGARWSEEPASETVTAGDPRSTIDVSSRGGLSPVLAAMLLVVVTGLPYAMHAYIVSQEVPRTVSLSLPRSAGEWSISNGGLTDWTPAFDNPSTQSHVAYRRGAQVVGVYLAYYSSQSTGRKLVSSDNVLVRSDDPRWAQVATGVRQTEFGGNAVLMRSAELRSAPLAGSIAEGRWLVWRTYWVDGHYTSSDHLAKALTAWARFRGRGDDSALIVLYAPRPHGGGDAVLEDFSRTGGTALDAALRQARIAR